MARKSKKVQQDATEQAAPAAAESTADAGKVEVSAPTPAPEAAAQVLDLHDAARRFVPGFQDRWWDGIRKHATAMGFGDGGTEEQCKSVLRHWGARC